MEVYKKYPREWKVEDLGILLAGEEAAMSI